MKPEFASIERGELYWIDWDPARGSEQAGRRPGLVVQEDAASTNPRYPLTIVAAVSTKGRSVPSHVLVQPSLANGLSEVSYVKCEQLMTVSKARLVARIGRLSPPDLHRVAAALMRVLTLP